MPFGLATAPSTFQRGITTVLAPMRDRANPYLDDILIHNLSVARCLADLEETLMHLEQASFVAKSKKCEILVEEMIYLGFKVTKDGILPDPRKVEAIRQLETPRGPPHQKRVGNLCAIQAIHA